MDFFEIIDTRKTNRNYEKEYIPSTDDIKRIIESARLAPSAVNAQNWRFIAVYNQEIKDQMAQEVVKKYDEILSRLNDEELKGKVDRYRGHSTFFASAPVVIVAVLTQSPSFMSNVLEMANYFPDELKFMRPDSQLLSIGGAIENMLLTARAIGLGSCWMAAPVLAHDGLKEVLKLDETEKIVSLITIGKPKDTEGRARKKGLDEIVSFIM